MNWRELKRKIDACLTEGRHLTRWEENFLEGLSDKLTMNERISPKEEGIVEKIYAEKVP